MTETETVPPPKPDTAPQAAPSRRKLFVKRLIGAVVLFALGAGVVLYSTSLNTPVSVEPETSEITAVQQRLADLEARFDALSQKEQLPPPVIETALVDEAIRRMEDRLGQIETANADIRQIIQKRVSAAFAFRDVRDAAKEGRNFTSELAVLRAATTGDPALMAAEARLDPYAVTPPPSLPHLREALTAEEKKAPQEEAAPGSWPARLRKIFRPLISIRPLNDPRFEEVKKALDAGDGSKALEAARSLPDELKTRLASWQAQLEARLALDAALKELAASFMAPSPDPSSLQGNAP